MSFLQKIVLIVAFLLIGSNAQPASAQSIDPRFPILGKSVFGVGSLYSPHAALGSPVSGNPAAENFRLDIGMPASYEVDYGLFETRSDFTLGMGIVNVMMPLSKRSSLRLSGYGLWSNSQSIPVTGPASIEHDGTAVELSYAYRLNSNLDLGLAIVPHDRVESELSLGNQTIASGSAESDFQGRLGLFWKSTDRKLSAGLAYSHDAISAESQVAGLPGKWEGKFLQRSWTGGVAYSPRPGTTVFYNYQHLNLKGEGVNTNRPSNYWGAQQFLSPKWVLRYARVASGNELSVGYIGKKLEGYVSFNDRAYSPAQDTYGRGGLLFVSAVKKF